jgi:hypothetical protein
MSTESNASSDRGQRVDAVIAAFLEAIATGRTPNREELLAQYPDLAEDLAAFFSDHDAVQQLAQPFHPEAPALAAPPSEAETLPPRPAPADAGTTKAHVPSETATLPPDAMLAPAPGIRVRYIGDYEILAELGRGGMGVVYQAQQRSLKRLVALKMMLAAEYAGEQELLRFRRETEAVARLQYPNIVQIYEVGHHQGNPFFSMEYVLGGSLADKLDGTPWSRWLATIRCRPSCSTRKLTGTCSQSV